MENFRSKQQTPDKTYKRNSLPSQSQEDENIDVMMKALKEIKKTHKRKREEVEEEAEVEYKQLEDIDGWEMAVEEVEEESDEPEQEAAKADVAKEEDK